MISVEVLSSGSKGNAYAVSNEHSSILLDCGLSWKKIQELSGWKKFDMCLITHEHKDHCKAVEDVTKQGIRTYIPIEAKIDVQAKHNLRRLNSLDSVAWSKNWHIKAFELKHDVPTLGYLITEKGTNDKLAYITDTMFCKWKFKGITHWLIECNHSRDIMNEKVSSGELNRSLRNRVVETHMSIETVKEMLLSNDLSSTKEIWLLHLSDGNSDAERFRREVQETTGKVVYLG